MDVFTYTYISTKIKRDLDLEEETFITDAELLENVNEAIDKAEAEVHTLYEDYFLTKASISLVAGTKQYALPTDIYLQKIRGVIYDDGNSNLQVIRRLRSTQMFEDAALLDRYPSSQGDYRYQLTNSSVSGVRIEFYPTPQETNSFVKIWYIRNAKRLAVGADVCDLPDICAQFVIAEAKVLCLRKEPGNPMLADALAERDRLEIKMTEALMARVPDADNTVEKDLSHYEEMS